MQPIISGREGDRIKIEVTIDLSGSMLEAEESILRGVNAVGDAATGEALKRFDADGRVAAKADLPVAHDHRAERSIPLAGLIQGNAHEPVDAQRVSGEFPARFPRR